MGLFLLVSLITETLTKGNKHNMLIVKWYFNFQMSLLNCLARKRKEDADHGGAEVRRARRRAEGVRKGHLIWSYSHSRKYGSMSHPHEHRYRRNSTLHSRHRTCSHISPWQQNPAWFTQTPLLVLQRCRFQMAKDHSYIIMLLHDYGKTK